MVMLTTWDSSLDSVQSLETLKGLALRHCDKAGIHGAALAALIRASDFASVCAYELDYSCDLPVDAVINVRQALAFFTKLDFLDIGIDKEAVARSKFFSTEGDCLRTNLLFNLSASSDFYFPEDVEHILSMAERKIADLLGEVPSLEDLDYLFGPGATTSVKRRNACAREKLSAVPSCSTNMIPLVPLLLGELPAYSSIHEEYIPHEGSRCPVHLHDGRLSFVPKNASTFRTVMTEPTLNALFQGALGRVLSQKLRRVGQDTRDQTRNQKLARAGSITGALATLDLSSASDSISIELVARLLPYEWFSAMSLCRTESISDRNKVIRLHKFSSMGNGFTFPLQTLIFWALASACVKSSRPADTRVSVYGDDIIIGTEAVPLFSKVLRCVGFQLNMSKSYWDGPFRESCGKDYYFGIDVRPFYSRHLVTGEYLFLLHNHYYRDYDFESAAVVLAMISPTLRIYGPDGYGDGHLLSNEWVRKPWRRKHGYAGFVFETYTWKPRYHFSVMRGDHVVPIYSTYVRENASSESLESGPTRHSVGIDGLEFPVYVVPGRRGYRRILIYTLTS